jgi:hypothetical protein
VLVDPFRSQCWSTYIDRCRQRCTTCTTTMLNSSSMCYTTTTQDVQNCPHTTICIAILPRSTTSSGEPPLPAHFPRHQHPHRHTAPHRTGNPTHPAPNHPCLTRACLSTSSATHKRVHGLKRGLGVARAICYTSCAGREVRGPLKPRACGSDALDFLQATGSIKTRLEELSLCIVNCDSKNGVGRYRIRYELGYMEVVVAYRENIKH